MNDAPKVYTRSGRWARWEGASRRRPDEERTREERKLRRLPLTLALANLARCLFECPQSASASRSTTSTRCTRGGGHMGNDRKTASYWSPGPRLPENRSFQPIIISDALRPPRSIYRATVVLSYGDTFDEDFRRFLLVCCYHFQVVRVVTFDLLVYDL